MVTATLCRRCGKEIGFNPLEGYRSISPTICDPCDKIAISELEQQAELERLRKFNAICPPRYQETNFSDPRLASHADKLKQVLAWKYGPTGLIVVGPTRCGKTRTMWQLLKRLMVKEGRSVAAVSAGELAQKIAWAAMNQESDVAESLDRMRNCDVLYIDDLGKDKTTERVESDLFTLLEHRYSYNLPTLYTSNFTGDILISKLSRDRGMPIIARIRESCKSISV